MDRHDKNLRPEQRRKIRELNDALRCHSQGGRTVWAQTFSNLDWRTQSRVCWAIKEFDGFNGRNDPWGEHDFGQVLIDAVPYFWKIDYFDVNLEYGSPDPADETVTCRVLTIMAAEDL